MLKNLKQLLKLSDNESEIIGRLEHPPYSFTASSLSRELKIPRRTVGFALNSLFNRKLVKKEGNHPKILWSLKKIPPEDPQKFETVTGIKNIQKKIWSLISLHGLERYHAIQGTEAVKEQIKIFDRDFIKSIHNLVKKKKIIVEGVITRSALQNFTNLSNEQLESHRDRLTVVYVVEDKILNFNHDFYVFGKTLCIVDYKKQTMLVIDEPEISSGVLALIKLSELYGEKIIMNEYINELIKNP